MSDEQHDTQSHHHESLEEAAAKGQLPDIDDSDTSDDRPDREEVLAERDGVIPAATDDLEPDRSAKDRQQAGEDETVAGLNISSDLSG